MSAAILPLHDLDYCDCCGVDPCCCHELPEDRALLVAELDAAATALLDDPNFPLLQFGLLDGVEPDRAAIGVHRRVPLPDGVDLDELLNAAQGPALDAFIRRRIEALQAGKDRAHDRDAAPHFLAHLARDRMIWAVDQLRGNDRPAARRNIEIAGALLLALWDRISTADGDEQ